MAAMRNSDVDLTDVLQAAFLSELEARRDEIEEQRDTLLSVSLTIKLDQNGALRRVIWRPECHRDFKKVQ